MKKSIRNVILMALLFCLNSFSFVSAVAPVIVKVNGQAVNFPDAQPYVNKDNRTMIPVRFVSQALGAAVDWNEGSRTVTITKDKKITLKVGERRAFVDGVEKTFDTSATQESDRVFVPLRFVSETFGAAVNWVGVTNTVEITLAGAVEKQSENVTVVSGSQNKRYEPIDVPSTPGFIEPKFILAYNDEAWFKIRLDNLNDYNDDYQFKAECTNVDACNWRGVPTNETASGWKLTSLTQWKKPSSLRNAHNNILVVQNTSYYNGNGDEVFIPKNTDLKYKISVKKGDVTKTYDVNIKGWN